MSANAALGYKRNYAISVGSLICMHLKNLFKFTELCSNSTCPKFFPASMAYKKDKKKKLHFQFTNQ